MSPIDKIKGILGRSSRRDPASRGRDPTPRTHEPVHQSKPKQRSPSRGQRPSATGSNGKTVNKEDSPNRIPSPHSAHNRQPAPSANTAPGIVQSPNGKDWDKALRPDGSELNAFVQAFKRTEPEDDFEVNGKLFYKDKFGRVYYRGPKYNWKDMAYY